MKDRFVRRARRLAVLAVVLGLALGCGPTVKQMKLYDKDPEHVWLQYEVQDDQVLPQHFDHPASLTKEQIANMLAEVQVEEHSFFAWRDQGQLFTEEMRSRLGPWLADALSRADANQWVHFAIAGMKQGLLFRTKRLTDGLCYVKDGKFHLVIANFDYELIDPNDKEFFRLDPRDRTVINGMRLRADPQKGYAPPPLVKDDKWLGQERRNWLVFDPALFPSTPVAPPPAPVVAPAPAPAQTATPAGQPPAVVPATPETAPPAAAPTPAVQAPAAPPPAPAAKPDVAERLRKLKEICDQGLLTPEECEKKRQEILQGL